MYLLIMKPTINNTLYRLGVNAYAGRNVSDFHLFEVFEGYEFKLTEPLINVYFQLFYALVYFSVVVHKIHFSHFRKPFHQWLNSLFIW